MHTGHPYLTEYGVFNGNAYGLLFLPLAYIMLLHPALPRVVFVSAWLAIGFFLFRIAHEHREKYLSGFFLFLLVFLNPFFIVQFLFFGINEIVAAFFVFVSVYLLGTKNSERMSGVFLALGFLFKITPIFLFPFFLFSKKGVRIRFLFSFLLTVGFGFFVGYLLWQNEILTPFLFGLGRDATFLSIAYFLEHSGFIAVGNMLASFSFVLLGIVLFGTLALHIIYRLDDVAISCIVFLEIFLVSKVNLPQYYTSLFVLLILYFLVHRGGTVIRRVIYLYLFWLSIIPLGYFLFNHFSGEWLFIRNFIGLPMFVMNMSMLLICLRGVFITKIKSKDK